MSEKTQNKNICQRILAVMAELDYIQKGPKTVNGQYRYASHDQVAAAVHPLLVKHGIMVMPDVIEHTQEGNRTVVKLKVSFLNADVPQEGFAITSLGYGIDSGDKGPGKAISYAYKYAILKAFCLETGDDPDEDAKSVYEPKKCLEFDGIITDDVDREKLDKFLEYSSRVLQKHVEDVKREAMKRPEEFLASLRSWKPKKKESL